jgi:Plasmid replication initiator protein
MREFVIERGNTRLTIQPSSEGRATQFDKDLLIYAVSQLMQAKKHGHEITRKVRLVAHDVLKTTHRGTDRSAYERLVAAGTRLRGTTLKVENLDFDENDRRRTQIFGFVDNFDVVEGTRTYRGKEQSCMIAIDITLNQKTFDAINSNSVLTMHESYFQLTSALDRRLYEIVRKGHGTNKPNWSIGVDKAKERSGSMADKKEFRRMLKTSIEQNLLPGYQLQLDGEIIKSTRAEEKVTVLPKAKRPRKPRSPKK